MENTQILFIDPADDFRMSQVVLRALTSTGCQVDQSASFDDLKGLSKSKDVDLVLINYDSLSEEEKQSVESIMALHQTLPYVLISESKKKESLVDLFSHSSLRNLVARNNQVSERELVVTTEKILRQDIFGLEKYLTWGIATTSVGIQNSRSKADLIGQVADFSRRLKCNERFVKLAEVVTDELLMNALYDAPTDKSGKHLYAHLPRSEEVVLDKGQATLTFGCDGQYLAISCCDQFGSLDAETVVEYLKRCFESGDNQISTKSGGGGVGFYMIFKSVSQLVINIEPGKRTETIGLIDIRSHFKETRMKTKSLNIFVQRS